MLSSSAYGLFSWLDRQAHWNSLNGFFSSHFLLNRQKSFSMLHQSDDIEQLMKELKAILS
jgi:hypothetical protein